MRRALLAALCALLAASCYTQGTIRRVAFHASARGLDRDASTPLVVHTPSGWDVTLTTAQVSVGPVYLRTTSSAAGTSDFGESGRAVAQILAHFTVDALDPAPYDVGVSGTGTTEAAVAAEVRLFDADSGPIADAAGAGSAVAHVAGHARAPDGHVVDFDGFLELPLASAAAGYDWSQAHRITNVDAMVTVDDGGTLALVVDPTHWVDSVVFDALPDDGTGLRSFDSDAARGQLKAGVGSRDAFALAWAP